jgi:hypothetical protein
LLRAPQARPEGRAEAVSVPMAAAATGEMRAVARGQAPQLTGEVRVAMRGQELAVGLAGARPSEASPIAKLHWAPQVTEAAVAGEQRVARGLVVRGWGWQRLLGVAVGMSMILSSSVPLAQVSGRGRGAL